MPIFRTVLGAVVGYIASVATSLGWFSLTRHSPIDASSIGFIVLTALVGILFNIAAGYIATLIGVSVRSAYAVAALIVIFSLWGGIETYDAKGALWSFAVAILFMAPAAIAGGLLRIRTRETTAA